ncbi:hypothetical protein AALO_G00016670%2C partial, partial [Xyrichtys novacula]
ENPDESDEEDYPLSYPLRFEVETRIIGPEVMHSTERAPDVTQLGNESSPPTHSQTIPENLLETTPEVQCSDIPSSPIAEEEPSLIQFPPDDSVDVEPVEKELPSNQSNTNAEPESSIEPEETKQTENDQEEEPITLSEPTTNISQEQNDTVESEVVQHEKTDTETPLLTVSDLPVVPNIDTPCPTESSPVESPDTVSEPDHDALRRSERQRRAPAKFTYPQLGKPFISFAHSILEAFNNALVETFEGNPFPRENVMKGLMPV